VHIVTVQLLDADNYPLRSGHRDGVFWDVKVKVHSVNIGDHLSLLSVSLDELISATVGTAFSLALFGARNVFIEIWHYCARIWRPVTAISERRAATARRPTHNCCLAITD